MSPSSILRNHVLLRHQLLTRIHLQSAHEISVLHLHWVKEGVRYIAGAGAGAGDHGGNSQAALVVLYLQAASFGRTTARAGMTAAESGELVVAAAGVLEGSILLSHATDSDAMSQVLLHHVVSILSPARVGRASPAPHYSQRRHCRCLRMTRAGLSRLWRLASHCALGPWVIFCVDVSSLAIRRPEGFEVVGACEEMVLADLRFVDGLFAAEQEETGQCVERTTSTEIVALDCL